MTGSVVGRFLRLPVRARSLLVRSVLILAIARLATWFLPFALSRRLVTRGRRRSPTGVTRDEIRWAIAHAQRVVPRATCVPQALAAESLLSRSGLPSELNIGVRKTPAGKLDAHAWVVSEGAIVVGDLPWGLEGYTRLPTLPSVWPGTTGPGPR